MFILGIETSCDETSVALLDNHILKSNLVYSQKIHAQFGGVVPEVASRAHLQKIDRLCDLALKEADCNVGDLELIAVTDSPGLAGALLVGISFAIGLHVRSTVPITGVNHLEGHIASILLEFPDMPLPYLALVVSGGHTAIYRISDSLSVSCLGQTCDDAAGEAFDKIGKLLGFPYPAGQAIETEARTIQEASPLRFPIARLAGVTVGFSYSGLKTAVKNHLERIGHSVQGRERAFICKAFQDAIVDSLLFNTRAAVRATGIPDIAVVGGVACNKALRAAMQNEFGERVRFPTPQFCTDNAAMIAKRGYELFRANATSYPRMIPTSRR